VLGEFVNDLTGFDWRLAVVRGVLRGQSMLMSRSTCRSTLVDSMSSPTLKLRVDSATGRWRSYTQQFVVKLLISTITEPVFTDLIHILFLYYLFCSSLV